MAVTSSREIASPSPVPPYSRVVDESAWVNGSKRATHVGGDAGAGVADDHAEHGLAVADRLGVHPTQTAP